MQAADLRRMRLLCSAMAQRERRFSLSAAATALAMNVALVTALAVYPSDYPYARHQDTAIPIIAQVANEESAPSLEPAPVADPVAGELTRFDNDMPVPPQPALLPLMANLFQETVNPQKIPLKACDVSPRQIAIDWPEDAIPVTEPVAPTLRELAPQSASAQTPGVHPSEDAANAVYWSAVRDRIARELRYPPNARRRGIEGVAAFRISLDTNGNLVAMADLTPKVDESLRHAGQTAIRRAAPFAPLAAAGTTSVAMTADVPVCFRLLE